MRSRRTTTGNSSMNKPFASAFYISSPYGYRVDPITGAARSWHGGVDLVSDDRNVRSVSNGTVLRSRIVTDRSDRTWEWGNYVAVVGEDGRIVYYCHLDRRAVETGASVAAGQIIGIEGATGYVTGRHLHFEVRDWAGKQYDPCEYIGIPNAQGFEWEPAEAHWWDEAMAWGTANGITDGTEPNGTATRAMLITMLKRYHDKFGG